MAKKMKAWDAWCYVWPDGHHCERVYATLESHYDPSVRIARVRVTEIVPKKKAKKGAK